MPNHKCIGESRVVCQQGEDDYGSSFLHTGQSLLAVDEKWSFSVAPDDCNRTEHAYKPGRCHWQKET
jgi:hypothetical protein